MNALKHIFFFLFLIMNLHVRAQSGAIDPSFNPGTGANRDVYTCSLQSDGKIILAGDFTSYNGTLRNRILRLNTNGSIDPSFNPGTGANRFVFTSAIQSDGKIIIGGWFTAYNWTSRNRIARLNTNGTLDLSFNPGTGANERIFFCSIQNDGKILIGGDFTSYNGTAISRIARLNADGTLDLSFNPGTGADNWVETISIQSDGKIIIGGYLTIYNGVTVNRIVRLNADGTIDPSFNMGIKANDVIYTTMLQSDGKIFIAGDFTSFDGTARSRVARLNSNGSLDMSFNPGLGVNDVVWRSIIQSDGKILIGGEFTTMNGVSRNRIARLNSDGSHDLTFDPGTAANDRVRGILIQNDDAIVLAGFFTTFNGISRRRVVRLINCVGLSGTDVITACDSITWIDGITYTSSNNLATFVLTNAAGCDSTVTLDLTIKYSSTGTDMITVCDSITWIDGITYTSSNNLATFVLTNAAGCDSTVTLDLTVNYSSTGTDMITACDSITWIDGITYSSSNNLATFVLTNAVGCDSTVTLDLTVNYSNSGTDMITACDSITWIDGITYTTSNNLATFVLTNAAGCDSTVTLDLTVNYSNTGTAVIAACDTFTWINGVTYTESSNGATYVLTNAAGCDSTVTLNLAINSMDVSVTSTSTTLTAVQNGATYQWLRSWWEDCTNFFVLAGETNQSYTPTQSAKYAVIIEFGACLDTSECTVINVPLPSGISELNSELQISIQPNPSSGIFSVNAFENMIEEIEIYNLLGEKILCLATKDLQFPIVVNISEQRAGMYLLIAKTKENRITRKIVKQD